MDVFLTGSTGFLGKVVLLDMLVNHCSKINKIYLLIRSKKNKSSDERFNQLINNRYLSKILTRHINKLVLIPGSLSSHNLNITHPFNFNNIKIVINCAASINFDEPINDAKEKNVDSLQNLIQYTIKNFIKLEKFIHVSTFYVTNPIGYPNIETFNIDYELIIKDIKDGLNLKRINKKYGLYYPNTYALTKFIAEQVIKKYNNIVIKCKFDIVRPSIITNSLTFPLKGWNDSFAGYSAFNVLFYTNKLRIACPMGKNLNLVPVDYVSKIILDSVNDNRVSKKISIRYAIINNNSEYSLRYLCDNLCLKNYSINKRAPIIINNKYLFKIIRYFIDYLPYKLLYFFTRDKRCKLMYSKGVKLFDTFDFYINHSWNSKFSKLKISNKDYYCNLTSNGNLKYLLNNDMEKYSIFYNEFSIKSSIYWLFTRTYWFFLSFLAMLVRIFFKFIFEDVKINLEKLVEVSDDICKRPTIYCSNHSSYCDAALICLTLFELNNKQIKLPYIIAASEFRDSFLIGSLLHYYGCIFVERNGKKDKIINSKINELLKNNQSILVFMEGTRSRTNLIGKIKTGILKCIQMSKVDVNILPISINYEDIIEKKMFYKEIVNNIKIVGKFSHFIRWCNNNVGIQKYGKAYINFSDMITLTYNCKKDLITRKIYSNIQRLLLQDHILSDLDYNKIVEDKLIEWCDMNKWIFKYLKLEKCNNFWEYQFILKYSYIDQSQIVYYHNYDKLHRKYFNYFNHDVSLYLMHISNNSKNKSKYKMYLGNIVPKFIDEFLYENNISKDYLRI